MQGIIESSGVQLSGELSLFLDLPLIMHIVSFANTLIMVDQELKLSEPKSRPENQNGK